MLAYFRSSEEVLISQHTFFMKSPNQRIELMRQHNAEKLKREAEEAQKQAAAELAKRKERDNARRIRDLETTAKLARQSLETLARQRDVESGRRIQESEAAQVELERQEVRSAKKQTKSDLQFCSETFAKQKQIAAQEYLKTAKKKKCNVEETWTTPCIDFPNESCSSLVDNAGPSLCVKSSLANISAVEELQRQIRDLQNVRSTIL